MSKSSSLAPQAQDSLLPYLAMMFFGLAWLVPDHYPPWSSFYNEYSSFAGLLALLLYCARVPGNRVIVPQCALLLALIACVPLLQFASGVIFFAGDAWMTAAYLVGLALAIWAGFIMTRVDAAGFTLGISWLFVTGAVLSSLLAIHQILDLGFLGLAVVPFPPKGIRPYANLAQPNQLATLLCLGLAALLYLDARQRIIQAGFIALGLLLILGIVLTQSRAPWLGAACLLTWWLFKRRAIPQIKSRPIVIGLTFYATLVLLWPIINSLGPKNTASAVSLPTQRPDLMETGTHLHNWQEMLAAIPQQPWLGYGWNQVSVAHVLAAQERPKYGEWLGHSHNVLLDLIIWNGLPIGLLLIALLLWWLCSRAWHCQSPESWLALAAIGFVGAHAMVEYPHTYAYFLLPIGLMVGLLEANHPRVITFQLPKILLWPVIAVFAGFMALIWHEYRIVEDDYRLMRFETRNIGPIKADKPAPDIFLLTQLREDLRMARTLARNEMSDEELEWMQRITYRYPWYSSLFRYAVSLALNGREEDANIEFRRIYDIYGAKPYTEAKSAVQQLTNSLYPELKAWQLPPP